MSEAALRHARGGRVGRPRLHEPEEERRILMDAALEVLRRNPGQDMTVGDILGEAGLSTRAFYRHFQTKEEIICALYQRDSESFGRRLRRRVAAPTSAVEALEAWIDELLSLGYDRRRRERMATFSSHLVGRVVAGTAAEQVGVALLIEPLREVIQDGRARGAFQSVETERDVRSINALTWEAISWAGGDPSLRRADALAHVLRFVLPALGVDSVGPGRP